MEYKETGVEWVGKVPEHWEIKRLFNICDFVRGNSGFEKNDLLTEGKYVALQYGKTYKVQEINEKFNFYVNDSFYKNSQTVNYGDVIFVSTSETIDDLGHSVFYNRSDVGLIGGEQILLKSSKNILDGKYLFYASKVFGKELKKFASGVKVFRFDVYDLKTIYISLPNKGEQIAIANYLDKACERIDNIIISKQQQLLRIDSYYKSKLHEIITKGLNKNVNFIDSKIDWQGKVPKHWKRDKLYRLANKMGSGGTPKSTNQEYYNGPIPWIQSGDLNDGIIIKTKKTITQRGLNESSAKIFSRGTVLIAMYGATIGKLGIMSTEAATNQACCAIQIGSKMDSLFLYYLLFDMRQYLISRGYGGGQSNISQEVLKQQYLYYPEIEEQKKIVEKIQFLERKTSDIKTQVNKQIKTLQDYRKSLIHEYVTGKKLIEKHTNKA
ncbi:restriction endonuclease subunit S [Flavobacterium sp.]|uniref:restriction endonuclease subunit S n=1 Tax=Flavobacterium sp. TaxID=239 RepID=UPI003F6A0DF5